MKKLQKLLLMTLFTALKLHAGTDTIFVNGFEASVVTPQQAARFLTQATFGPTLQSVQEVEFSGFETWIDNQMIINPTYLRADMEVIQQTGVNLLNPRLRLSWNAYVKAQDQLRQRIAFALSEILVTAEASGNNSIVGTSFYNDLLVENAFGNFRELLEKVTLSPMMGIYLSMRGNAKADPVANTRADENFAREIMQLFTVGLNMLNIDGSEQLDINEEAIISYDINHVKELARVFTGWTYANANSWNFASIDYFTPMEAYRNNLSEAQFHDFGQKSIVGSNGVNTVTILNANLTPEEDLQQALDTLFNHPNVGPFISKQLIQKLITSNPTPAYIQRVTTVFNNDGTGVRGNLAAVIKAILLDIEARDESLAQNDRYGKLREPVLKLTNLWRAYDVEFDFNGGNTGFGFIGINIAQSPYHAPHVFNFYSPNFVSNFIDDPSMLAPEFQLDSESNLITYQNLLRSLTDRGISGSTVSFRDVALDGAPLRALLRESNSALLDNINLLLFYGAMPTNLYNLLDNLLVTYANDGGAANTATNAQLNTRIGRILYVAMSTPQYNIQK